MKMLNWKIAVILLFHFTLFFSCRNQEATIQPQILEEELVDILTKALILEPAIREIQKTKQDSFEIEVYERILSEKGYTMDAFVQSMQWAQADPKKLTAIYEQVMEELVTIETETDNVKKDKEEK